MLSPYLVENRHIAVKRCRHGLFMYNRNDAFVGRSLDLYGEWCDFELQTLQRFVQFGDTVVDVGANIGTHTVAFANMVGVTGLVHAFEPYRRLFHMLAGNLAINAIEHVHAHQKAVGDVVGEAALSPLPAPVTHFNFAQMSLASPSEAGERVPLVTIDSLGLKSCRLIKIDSEGTEAQVLAGAQQTIKECQPILYVENDRPDASRKLSAQLAQIGYRGFWSLGQMFSPRNFYANIQNIWPDFAPSANLLCLPQSSPVDVSQAEPFLGENDNWQAAAQRMQNRAYLAR